MTALLAVLLLGGCLWPMDAVPEWKYTFEGTAVRSGTTTAVAGAQVQIWLLDSTLEPAGKPFLEGVTDSGGGYRMQGRFRSSVPAPDIAVRVTPPAGSGLLTTTLSGFVHDFSTRTVSGRNVTVRTAVVLAAAP
ncbi:hypothetical protein [Longimicrobium sp.]|uniref:hypothetical protein n=1 Tax=Longimicrobium sp. TaxID=2029185 RepID=UPI002ED7FC41